MFYRLIIISLFTLGIFVPSSSFAGSGKEEATSTKSSSQPARTKQVGTETGECLGICAEIVAENLLKSAKEFIGIGESKIGKRYLRQILKKYPQTSAAKIAAFMKPLDQSGRTEFIVFTTSIGIAAGIMIPTSFQSNSPEIFGLSLLLFTGTALAGSIIGTRGLSMSVAQTRLIETATLWMTWNFGVIANTVGLTGQDTFKLLTAGMLLGYTGSFITTRYLPLQEGQITFASTFGLWTMAYTGLTLAIAQDNGIRLGSDILLLALMLASDVGLIVGAGIHQFIRFSRARTMLVSLGGLVGGVTGAGVILIASSGNGSVSLPMATMMVSSITGMILAMYFTRKMKPAAKGAYLAGNSLINYQQGQWFAGVPIPQMSVKENEAGKVNLGFSVPIVSGRW